MELDNENVIDLENQINQSTEQPIEEYDQYYGGHNIQYSVEQIENYEQNYDQYGQDYNNYYNSYYVNQDANQVSDDRKMHQELYQYYLENKEYMKENFPKKRKIYRWEEVDQNYNSLEASEEFMNLLDQIQDDNKNESINEKESKEFADVI